MSLHHLNYQLTIEPLFIQVTALFFNKSKYFLKLLFSLWSYEIEEVVLSLGWFFLKISVVMGMQQEPVQWADSERNYLIKDLKREIAWSLNLCLKFFHRCSK